MTLNQYWIPLLGLFLVGGVFLGALITVIGNKPLRTICYFWLSAIVFHMIFLSLRLIQFTLISNGLLEENLTLNVNIQCFLLMANISLGLFFLNLRKPKSFNQQFKLTLIMIASIFLVIFFVINFLDEFFIRELIVLITLSSLFYCLYKMFRYSQEVNDPLIYLLIFMQIVLIATSFIGLYLILKYELSFGVINVSNERVSQGLGIIRLLQILIFALIYFYINSLILSKFTKSDQFKKEENEQLKLLSLEKDELIISLERSNKLVISGALSASLAHELSQPLASIQVNSDLLLLKLQDDKTPLSSLNELIVKIVQANERAGRVIHSLKALFSGRSRFRTVDINELVDSCCEIVRTQLRHHNISLTLNHEAVVNNVYVNAQEVRQVLLNLLTNACQAFEMRGSTAGNITVSVKSSDGHLQIMVADNAGGVADELVDQVFELMKTTKKDGMGFGLWLARYIIEKSGGSLWLQNVPGLGATFIIDLPMKATATDVPRLGDVAGTSILAQ